jgi:hypothetical protein
MAVSEDLSWEEFCRKYPKHAETVGASAWSRHYGDVMKVSIIDDPSPIRLYNDPNDVENLTYKTVNVQRPPRMTYQDATSGTKYEIRYLDNSSIYKNPYDPNTYNFDWIPQDYSGKTLPYDKPYWVDNSQYVPQTAQQVQAEEIRRLQEILREMEIQAQRAEDGSKREAKERIKTAPSPHRPQVRKISLDDEV